MKIQIATDTQTLAWIREYLNTKCSVLQWALMSRQSRLICCVVARIINQITAKIGYRCEDNKKTKISLPYDMAYWLMAILLSETFKTYPCTMLKINDIIAQIDKKTVTKKYRIRGRQSKIGFTLTYEGEKLSRIEFDEVFTKKEYEYVAKYLPYTEEHLAIFRSHNSMEVIEVPREVSFEVFWNKYRNKQSKREAQRAWNRLSKPDQLLAIEAIRDYDRYLERVSWRSKMLPQKWINARHFETEWGKINN